MSSYLCSVCHKPIHENNLKWITDMLGVQHPYHICCANLKMKEMEKQYKGALEQAQEEQRQLMKRTVQNFIIYTLFIFAVSFLLGAWIF